jgi:hypothetical protein
MCFLGIYYHEFLFLFSEPYTLECFLYKKIMRVMVGTVAVFLR